MHHDYPLRPTLRERIVADLNGIDEILSTFIEARSDPLEYTRLPNGDLALLRAERPAPEPRYVLTDRGRDVLRCDDAINALFAAPWPTVAELVNRGHWDV